MQRPQLALLALCLAAVACGAPPQRVSMFGDVDVTFKGDFASLGDLQQVVVGGIHAYDLRPAKDAITVHLQGHPTPGLVDVQLIGSKGQHTLTNALEYEPALKGVPEKWVAFGASLTQGFQSGGIAPHGAIHGYAAQLARAAGVYLGLPLFNPAFIPPLQPSDFNPDCTQKPGTDVNAAGFFGALTDPTTKQVEVSLGRVDPSLAAQDIAVGGETINEFVNGSQFPEALIERIIEEPFSSVDDLFNPLTYSQLDRLEQLDPDIGISTDLLANDTDNAVTASDDVHPEQITSVATAAPMLQQISARLGKLHGQYFIANMFPLSFVPDALAIGKRRIAAGQDTEESFNAKLQQVDQNIRALNDALASAMAPYPNLHLVDVYTPILPIEQTGVQVGSEVVLPVKFGGLFSLDDLHLTDTGYALLANIFVDALNQTLHTAIPHVDVVAAHAADELSADALRADGLTCAPAP